MADVASPGLSLNVPQRVRGSLDGLITDVNAGELDVNNVSYTYIDLVRSGLPMFSLSWVLVATTITFEVSNDLASVPPGDQRWDDITLELTDGDATVTTSGTLSVIFPLPWARMRVRRLTTNVTNGCELRLTRLGGL